MKSYKHLLIIILSLFSLGALAQTNKKTLNYQAVILDPKAIDIPGASITGQPLNNGKVCLRFSLLNAQGGLDYEETQQVTTDEYGLVNVAIGTGSQAQASNSTSIYKSFESIVWNANVKSLKVSVSYDGCNSFKQVSTQIFNYTPYALYAEAVDYKNVREAPTKLSQFANDAGFLIPKDLDPLKTDIQVNSSKIEAASKSIADNKQASDAAFLVVNQSITSLDKQVAQNTSSITTINTKITDQQNQINDNRNQIIATNNNLNTQIGGLQGQLNTTNSTVSSLTGTAEVVSNKSTATNLGGANPSDQAYPSQRATKAYVDNAIYDAVGTGVPDATTLAAGKVKLAGDLGGTAMNPTVPALAGKENTANKSINVVNDGGSDTKYPSVKAVKAYVDQATMGTALQATVDGKADKNSPTFTGTPVLPTGTTGVTQTSSDNSTKLATTAFVQAATAGIALQAAVDLKAPIESPTFTGTPSLPTGTTGVTQAVNDNSTKLATTAFVTSSLAAGAPDATTTATGKVQLAGDLGGTAAAPTVPGLALKANTSDVTSSLALKEDVSRKSTATDLGASSTSDILYPSQKAVKSYVDAQVAAATIADADASTKGKLQLAGDLGGTAAAPTVPGLALKAPIESPTFTGTVGGITKSMVGLANVDNTTDANKPVSTAAQTALDLKEDVSRKSTSTDLGAGSTSDVFYPSQKAVKTYVDAQIASGAPDATTTTTGKIQLAGDLGGNATAPTVPGLLLKAPIESPTFTGTVGGITKSMVGLGNVDNTADADKSVSTAAQTALNLKAPLASPTFTGTVGGITKSMVGLGNVDNTADADKPVSTAAQSALNLKAPLASPTFTGTVTSPIYASAPQALTDAATISWNPTNGLNANVTLGGNRTLSFSAAPASGSYGTLVVTQDGTGGRTLTLPSGTNRVLGSSSTTTIALSSTAGAKDILNFYYDGLTSTYYWNVGQGYGTAATVAPINLATGVTSTLAIGNGGTGATTAAAALTNLGAQSTANLSTDVTTDAASTSKYPAVKTIKDYVDASVTSGAPNATTSATGKVQLAGDLAGTSSSATAPVISDNAITTIKINGSAVTSAKIAADAVTSAKILDGEIVNADISTTAAIVDTKLATIATSGKVSNSATTATDANTASTIVARDANGNFTAGTITSNLTGNVTGNLTGNAATATTATSFSGNLSGDVTGTQSATVVGKINGTSLAGLSTGLLKNTTSTGVPSIATAGTDYAAGTSALSTGILKSTTTTGALTIAEASDFPTLNQNTTGTSANVTGTVAVANGGTGATTAAAALTNLGAQSTANLSTDVATDAASTLKYPAVKAIKDYVDASVTSGAPDANATTKGKIQLAGDLAGTNSSATAPVISDNAITTIKINGSAVTSAKIAADAVTSAKILDGEIVNADISTTAAIADTKLATIATSGKVSNSATTATADNTASAIVARDANGNFTAGTITANLTGNVTGNAATATKLAATKNINGVAFDGSSDITVTAAAGTLSGTSLNSSVVSSSLTSVGTLTDLTVTNSISGSITGTAANVTGTVAVANGGTGATSAAAALTNLGAQSTANLSTDVAADAASTSKYPAVKAIKDYVDTQISSATIADANATTKGKIQLAGDLAGTGSSATAPVISADAITTVKIINNAVTSDKIKDGEIVNADISTTAAIADTKLATIATSGKVSNSATTATADNTVSAIVARDANGNFTAGTITANLTGLASRATNINGGSLGAIPYQSAANTTTLLPGNTAATKKFLTQTGDGGSAAAAPVWAGVAVSDITGTLPVANGGIGVTTTAANLVFAGPTSGATPAAPSFRSLVAADLPTGSTNYVNNGTAQQASTDFNISGSGTIGTTLNVTGNTTIGGTATITGATTLSALTATKGVFTDASKRLTSVGTLGTDQGGTGMASFNNGGAMYATSTSELTTGTLPTSAGGTGLTSYTNGGALYTTSTTAITSGTLPVSAGGTGATTAAAALTSLGAQSTANLSTDVATDATSTSKYPAVKTMKDYVDASVTSGAPDANATTKGKVQLAGDLAGTGSSATAPVISDNAITTIKINADAVTSAKIADGAIVNADINTSAAIADTKLATIATSGKVSNSATTATDANTASAIVARDANGNFTAGTITANLTGNATNVTGTVAIANGGTGVTTAAANAVFAGPASGASPAAPSFRGLVAADLPSGSTNYINNTTTQQSASFNISGSGTVGTDLTLSALTASKPVFTDTNRKLTSAGTLGISQGGTGLTTTPTNGQILIGNGTGFTLANLSQGTGISISTGTGSISIAAAVRPTTDQFSATANQTTFTLTQTPLTNANSKDNVWMFINGVRTNNDAYSVSGTTVTYVPGSNGSYALLANDRIQFDYMY